MNIALVIIGSVACLLAFAVFIAVLELRARRRNRTEKSALLGVVMPPEVER